MRIDEFEIALGQFEDRHVGGRARTERAEFGSPDRRGRYGGRAPHDVLEGHAQVQHLGHGGRQVVDRSVDVYGVQVRADGVGEEPLLEGRLGHVEAKAAGAVAHVHQDAPGPPLDDVRPYGPVVVQYAVGVAVIGVGDDVARAQQVHDAAQRTGRVAHVDHDGDAELSGRLHRQARRFDAVVAHQVLALAHLDAGHQVPAARDGSHGTVHVHEPQAGQFGRARRRDAHAGDIGKAEDPGAGGLRHVTTERILARPARASGVHDGRYPGGGAHVVRDQADVGEPPAYVGVQVD